MAVPQMVVSNYLLRHSPHAFLLSDLFEQAWASAHNAIDAEADQAAHFIGLVNRPHMYRNIPSIAEGNESTGRKGNAVFGYRHLRAVATAVQKAQAPGCKLKRRDIARSGTSTCYAAKLVAYSTEPAIAEAGKANTVQHVHLLNELKRWLKRMIALNVNIEMRLRKGDQRLFNA